MASIGNPGGCVPGLSRQRTSGSLNVKNEGKASFMTQNHASVDDTSDAIDALRKRFPKIVGLRKDDICLGATTNRQEAVRALAEQADVVLVVGRKLFSTSQPARRELASQTDGKNRVSSTMRRYP